MHALAIYKTTGLFLYLSRSKSPRYSLKCGFCKDGLCLIRATKQPAHASTGDMSTHKRKATSANIRLQIAWKQDWKCSMCEQTLHWTFEVDHNVALFNGGSNDYKNLQALCVKCHRMKSMQERGCAPETVLLATHKRCETCNIVYSLYFKHTCIACIKTNKS